MPQHGQIEIPGTVVWSAIKEFGKLGASAKRRGKDKTLIKGGDRGPMDQGIWSAFPYANQPSSATRVLMNPCPFQENQVGSIGYRLRPGQIVDWGKPE